MSLFRRNRRTAEEDGPQGLGVDEAGEYTDADEGAFADGEDGAGVEDDADLEPAPSPLSDRSAGPWDESEVPDPEGYLDLGAIRLRGRDGMELRLEVEEQTGRVTGATVHLGGSAVQLQAFAAPRSSGIWDEIRTEIAAGIDRQGGTVDEVPGLFGRELLARVPVRSADGRSGTQAVRFAGIDGPRWFLRAVFHGQAAYQPEAATDLEAVVRDIIVLRGAEAMAPRELLPMRLPDAGGPEAADVAQDERPPLNPFERGPEITEVR